MPNLAPVLLAESDANDVALLRRAFEKVRIPNPLLVVHDGRQAIEYLGRRGRYKDPLKYPWPCLMLLALKLRLMDGAEVLSWWKEHEHIHELPIIVLTSLASPSRIEQIMSLGATDYRFRPRDFDGLIDLVQELRFGWVERRALSVNNA
jgi:CheY-like chemotaxis protein